MKNFNWLFKCHHSNWDFNSFKSFVTRGLIRTPLSTAYSLSILIIYSKIIAFSAKYAKYWFKICVKLKTICQQNPNFETLDYLYDIVACRMTGISQLWIKKCFSTVNLKRSPNKTSSCQLLDFLILVRNSRHQWSFSSNRLCTVGTR